MKIVHPPDRLRIADLTEIDLGGLQVLVPHKITFDTTSRGTPFLLAYVAEYLRRSWGDPWTFNLAPSPLTRDLVGGG